MFKLLLVCLLLVTKYATGQENSKVDPDLVILLRQFLLDVNGHNKTLDEIPKNVRDFLDQFDSPSDLITAVSIRNLKENAPIFSKKTGILREFALWKRLIFDLIMHKGRTSHLPKPILDYIHHLSDSPNFSRFVRLLFAELSFDPPLVAVFVNFLDKLTDHEVTVKEMPEELRKFIDRAIKNRTGEELMYLYLRLSYTNPNPTVLRVDTHSDKMVNLWKIFFENVAWNLKGKTEVPKKLRNHFKQIISNPNYVDYIKVIFDNNYIELHELDETDSFLRSLSKNEDSDEYLLHKLHKYKGIQGQPKDWNLTLRDINPKANAEDLKQFLTEIASSKDLLQTLFKLFDINPDLLQKWKLFMKDLKEHKKSLTTMPDDLKSYITEIKEPVKFIRLMNIASDPFDQFASIPKPTMEEKSSWTRFIYSLNEKPNLYKIDNIKLDAVLSKYIRKASNNTQYQKDVQFIFQFDQFVLGQFEEFRLNMTRDYNVTLDTLPKPMVEFIYERFADIGEGLKALLASYPGINEIKEEKEDLDNWILRSLPYNDLITIAYFSLKFDILELVKGTIIEQKVIEVFKFHETNNLITRIENLWQETEKNTTNIFDKYADILDKFKYTYNNRHLFCGHRFEIVESLDKIKTAITSSVTCKNPEEKETTIEDLWIKTKDEFEVHDGIKVFLKFLDKFRETLEPCDHGKKFMEALDKARNGFAVKSDCI